MAKMRKTNQEDPNQHWDNVNVKDRVVLDLGCGDFGNATSFKYPTTLEYFLNKEAKFVVGVDSDLSDVTMLLSKQLPQEKHIIINDTIDSSDKILSLVKQYNIEIIKSDIEGGERFLFDLNDDDFCLIDEYYIETHGTLLYNECLKKLNYCGYDIYDQLNLSHTEGSSKVIFARKKT